MSTSGTPTSSARAAVAPGEKFNVIVLAGGSGGPLTNATGVLEKAVLTVHDKPMLDWVVETFARSEEVGEIVVVGSSQLDRLRSMQHVRTRLPSGVNVVQNLLHAVAYIKARLYKGQSDHLGYVFSFCDVVFLTDAIVTETLREIRKANADIVLFYVERTTFERAGLPAERTYIEIDGGQYTGSGIYYVRSFGKVLGSLDKLAEMRKNRKDPRGILSVLGCEGHSMQEIEQALSKHLDASVRILISPHAEMGMDVDKPSDYALARRLLEPPRFDFED